MQRVKDPERFKAELEQPVGGRGMRTVTAEEVEDDGRSFMAFASAMGVKVPNPNEEAPAALPSS